MLKKILNVAILFIITLHIAFSMDKPDSFDRNNNPIRKNNGILSRILENDRNWKKNKKDHDYWEKRQDYWGNSRDFWENEYNIWVHLKNTEIKKI